MNIKTPCLSNTQHNLLFGVFILWCLYCCTASVSAFAASELDELRPYLSNEWVQVQDDKRNQIKAYIRQEDDKAFRSFKASMVLNANVKTLANILLDFDNYTKWYWKTQTSQLVKQLSATHFIVYIVHDLPYKLPSFDTVLDGMIEPQTATQSYLTIKVTALPNYLPLQPPLKRMVAEDMSVRITPLSNERIHIEVQGYFEAPKNVLPLWAANMIQRTAPYSVLIQLKKMTNLEQYQKADTPIGFPIYDYEAYHNHFKSTQSSMRPIAQYSLHERRAK